MSLNIVERNQQNAQSSTGPTTDAGKLRSSQNALKHGLYSNTVLLRNESREEYDAFSTSIVDDLKPQGPMEVELARSVADYLWRLRRASGLESAKSAKLDELINLSPDDLRNYDLVEYSREQEAPEIRKLESFGRHHQRLQNGMMKILKELKDLQKQREIERKKAEYVAEMVESGFVSSPRRGGGSPDLETSKNTISDTTDSPLNPQPDVLNSSDEDKIPHV